MFDIGWSELVVIGIVALIAIGPKELPGVLRSLGHWMGKVRRMASEFQDQFREAMREAEVADLNTLKKQFESGFDNPLDVARREMEKAIEDRPLAAPDAAEPASAPESVTPDFPVPEVPPSVVVEGPKSDATEGAPVQHQVERQAEPQIEPTVATEPKREGSGAA